MARNKAAIKQNDFSRGAIRAEMLEADEDPSRQRSYRNGKNVRPVAQRGVARRYGTGRLNTFTGDDALPGGVCQIEPERDVMFFLVFVSGGLKVYDEDGVRVATFSSMPWTSAPWVASSGETTIIGGAHAPYVLDYDAGSWALAPLSFYQAPSGAIAQPQYHFADGIRIKPSAVSGSGITIDAESAVFTPDYVNLRIRYHESEIKITGYTSPTQVTGDVVNRLPPSHTLTLTSASGFRTGEIVVGTDTEWNGYISAVDYSLNQITTVSLSGFEGALVGEKVVGPNTKAEVTAKAGVNPKFSPYWTEPMISPVRGYPRAGAIVAGRLILCDFDEIPNIIAASSARALNDFNTGLEDDDAIIRQVGDSGKRVRHAINAGDLLFLTDGGSYYVSARDGTEVTPSNFMPVRFDSRAAGVAPPVFVDNAVFYTSANDILMAMLTGNVYLNWSVVVVSEGYEGQFGRVSSFAAPGKWFNNDDRSILAITEQGQVVSIYNNTAAGDLGLFVWEFGASGEDLRDGDDADIMGAADMNGKFWIVVKRRPNASASWQYMIEELQQSTIIDSVTTSTGGTRPSLSAYGGFAVTLMQGDNFLGVFDTYTEAEDYVENYPSAVNIDAGLGWSPWMEMWPFELIQSQRNGMVRARTIRVGVSVRDTTSFYVTANSTTRRIGPYAVGDSLQSSPPGKTAVYRFTVFGNRDHPEITIGQDIPGSFEVLAYIAEVQG